MSFHTFIPTYSLYTYMNRLKTYDMTFLFSNI